MKQKDIALIVLIAAVSAGLSFAVSHLVFGGGQDHQQTAAVVDVITTDFTTPDPKFFNTKSINAAKLIQVGGGTNTNPFNGTGH